jgi:tetratricopeptide (TPR) repeat protein
MHPLVHKWARERPDMSISEQGLWCGAAAILLAHCILIPPLGNTTEDEEIQRLLLPHVDHVRECQTSIEDFMRKKRITRTWIKLWPVLEPIFSREKALMYAKFSIVYAQNGRWEEAKKLQLEVKNFTMQYLGLKHATTRRVTLALAGTMITLSEIDEAAALQEQVLTACIAHLGADHHETLVTKGTLGECRFLQGRTTDAKILHEEAVAGLTKLYGVDHEDTLNAIDHLGQAVLMFWTEDAIRRARDLHLQAVIGMQKIHGHDHLRTLIACENLCKTAVQSCNPDHLRDAHDMMIRVYETRKRKLGKEHAYTLLAMMHLAFVKRGLGHLKDAEELILLALPIAERNLGTDHVACLWGRYHLGIVWVQQKRWDKAERHLLDLTERQRSILQGRGRLHPDRLGALTELATLYDALGKFEEYDKVVAEVLDGFEKISESEHPVAKKLREDTQRRVEKRPKTV